MSRNYAIGNNGCAVRVNSPLLAGWKKCRSLEELCSYVEHPLRDDIVYDMDWNSGKIPSDLLKQVLGTIHEFPHMETGYILCFRLTDRSWKIECPEQRGASCSVSYEGEEKTDGYIEIGTIHTHPNNLGAFWSSVDNGDMDDTPGIYVVFGLDANGKPESYKCTVVSTWEADKENNSTTTTSRYVTSWYKNKKVYERYDKDLWDIFEETDLQGDYEPVEEWVETIKKQSYRKKEVATVPEKKEGATPSYSVTYPSHNFDWGSCGWPYDGFDDESDVGMRGGAWGRYGQSCVPKSKPQSPPATDKLFDRLYRERYIGKLLEEYDYEEVLETVKKLAKTDDIEMSYYLETSLTPDPAEMASALVDLMEMQLTVASGGRLDLTDEYIEELNIQLGETGYALVPVAEVEAEEDAKPDKEKA